MRIPTPALTLTVLSFALTLGGLFFADLILLPKLSDYFGEPHPTLAERHVSDRTVNRRAALGRLPVIAILLAAAGIIASRSGKPTLQIIVGLGNPIAPLGAACLYSAMSVERAAWLSFRNPSTLLSWGLLFWMVGLASVSLAVLTSHRRPKRAR